MGKPFVTEASGELLIRVPLKSRLDEGMKRKASEFGATLFVQASPQNVYPLAVWLGEIFILVVVTAPKKKSVRQKPNGIFCFS